MRARPDIRRPAVRPARRLALTLCAAAALVACKRAPAPAAARAQGSFSGQLVGIPNLVSVDWDLKFWLLGSTPQLYDEYQTSSTLPGGQFAAVLPCLAPSGRATNQLQATAQLWLEGQSAPVAAQGTALFTCVTGLDAAVNLVLTVSVPGSDGFTDPTGIVAGVSCVSKVDWKSDTWLAVCGSSSCGDAEAVFLFANSCQDLTGSAPGYWACGWPTDWNILSTLATSQFAVPARDGQWTFGIAATPQLQLGAADPTLTDPSGNLLVFQGVPAPRATLTRTGGANAGSISAARVDDFAVSLSLAAQGAGGPAPAQLLEIRNGASGASAAALLPFSPCDAPVQGAASWSNLYAIGARLQSPGTASLLFAAQPGGLAIASATCTAQWGAGAAPQISCTSAGDLP